MKKKILQNKLTCLVGLIIALCSAGCYVEVYDIYDGPDQATAWTPLYLKASVSYDDNYIESTSGPGINWSIKNAGTTKAKINNTNYLFAMAPGTIVVSATATGSGMKRSKITKTFTITVLPAPEEIHTLGTELSSHNANTANNPVLLKASLDLEVNWIRFLDMLIVADRYVNLDLTESTGTQIPGFSSRPSSFDMYSKKVLSMVLPEDITGIGTYAFSYYRGLTSVSMGDNVIDIGDNAFYNCKELSNIVIPASVTRIGKSVFDNCTNLTAINVAPGNTMYSSIDGILYDKTAASLINCPNGKTGLINIPDTVTSIENSAFSACNNLASVIIPDNVISIGISAFSNCGRLGTIIIGNKVETIGTSAFEKCRKLTSVIIPGSVISIGDNAFRDCNELITVTFKGAITQSGFVDHAFPGDLRLKYFANSGGPGTYTRNSTSDRWSKE